MFTQAATPIIQAIQLENNPKNVQLFLKRDDLLHPIISGNKWHKLKYNLIAAEEQRTKTLLTFGGAYSNHIHAVAAAAKENGFHSIGVIRGEEHLPLNPTLQDADEWGMELHYMPRQNYREKYSPNVIEDLKAKFGNFYLIPEGGTNELAIRGVAEIVRGIEKDYDIFCVACGTAGTVSGIISGLNGKGQVLGFSVLKGNFHQQEVKHWLEVMQKSTLSNWQICTEYHFGGYAKYNLDLVKFINNFKAQHKIPLDPIYTGKMLYGLTEMISKGQFSDGTRILALHSGGLQGIIGFNQRHNNLIHT